MDDEEQVEKPYKVREYAELWRVTPNAVYTAVRRGELPSVRFGRVIRIPRDAGDRRLKGETATLKSPSRLHDRLLRGKRQLRATDREQLLFGRDNYRLFLDPATLLQQISGCQPANLRRLVLRDGRQRVGSGDRRLRTRRALAGRCFARPSARRLAFNPSQKCVQPTTY